MPCKVKVRFSGLDLSGLTRVKQCSRSTWDLPFLYNSPSHFPVLGQTWASRSYSYMPIRVYYPNPTLAHHIFTPFQSFILYFALVPSSPPFKFPLTPRIRAPSLSISTFTPLHDSDVTSFPENPTDLTLEGKSTRDAQRSVAR
jgi:hypothetical protein